MNDLSKNLESAIRTAIEEYTKTIAQKYEQVEAGELENIWNTVSENMKISVSFTKKKQQPTMKSFMKNIAPEKKVEESSGCPYVFTKMARKGQTCGANPRKGFMYCSRHKKYEGQPVKDVNRPKKKIDIEKEQSPKVKKGNANNRILRKNAKLGRMWHPESRLVFDEKTKRTVVGIASKDETKILPLGEDGIDLCMKYHFKYKKEDKSDDESKSSNFREVDEHSAEIEEKNEEEEKNTFEEEIDAGEAVIRKALGLSDDTEETEEKDGLEDELCDLLDDEDLELEDELGDLLDDEDLELEDELEDPTE